jgi:DNA-binding transcriptional regulator YiaG
MIHLDTKDGPKWLTDDELKVQYPALYAAINKPRPYAEAGEALQKLRLEAHFGLREFAGRLGIRPSVLNQYERGIRDPAEIEDRYREAL